ncbi:MAG TPA: LptF/LptG family permease [Candidatus Saccharimonadales bacterium]|nr:LptF/LptG family permease [Candidatus Saccharimonadales bacterium]
MRLLDRYLLRELLVPFSYCLSGFFVFWISFDLFAELAEFQRRKLKGLEVAQYYMVKTPELLITVLPVALLLALLYALTNLSRHHELTAIRAAGVSIWRMAVPYLAVGFIASCALFALNEVWVPESAQMADEILDRNITTKTNNASKDWERKLGFTNTRQNRKWFIEAYNVTSHAMYHPYVEWTLATGTRYVITAEWGHFLDQHWVFTNVQEQVFPPIKAAFPSMTETNLLVMEQFTETPDEIQSEIKVSKIRNLREVKKAQISIQEILAYKNLHSEDSAKNAMLDTKLYGRIAAPWTCLVVVLLALPFGAMTGRRNVYVGVASSIVICFLYFVLTQVMLALGAGGYLPPILAAWLPLALFAAGGVYMTRLLQ